MDTFAARTLCEALIAEPGFWQDVEAVRNGASAEDLAAKYVRRRRGRRVELLAELLDRAAEVGPSPDERRARSRVRMSAPLSYFRNGEPSIDAPARELRRDNVEKIERAALRIARRGSNRCAAPECSAVDENGRRRGARLAGDADADYCAACLAARLEQNGHDAAYLSEADAEGDYDLFDGAIAAVLGDQSKAQRRREARALRESA